MKKIVLALAILGLPLLTLAAPSPGDDPNNRLGRVDSATAPDGSATVVPNIDTRYCCRGKLTDGDRDPLLEPGSNVLLNRPPADGTETTD